MPRIKRVIRSKWFLWTASIMVIIVAAFSIFSHILVTSAAVTFVPKSIEETYASLGEYKVDTAEITGKQGEKLYRIYYPQSKKVAHPLIAWGNGTGALPDQYKELHQHLASWGFVVIDSYSTTTGTGKEIMASIEYMLAENKKSDSPFYQKIQEDQIGAAGHSQGSTGVINAHTNFERGNVIKTVVSIALPKLEFCEPKDAYDTSKLKVPFFIMSGTRDFIISPASSNKKALSTADPKLPVMMAMAKGAAHTAIEHDGGKHRGYLTAWMRYQLMADSGAKGAFVGNEAELATNTGWKDVYSANMLK